MLDFKMTKHVKIWNSENNTLWNTKVESCEKFNLITAVTIDASEDSANENKRSTEIQYSQQQYITVQNLP